MKFLLLSIDGAGLPIAIRLKLEGNNVAVYIHKNRFKHLYDGMVKKLEKKEWGKWIDDKTIIIFDTVKSGKVADRLRRQGHYVVGAGEMNDRMELDRQFGMELAKKAGLKVPPEKEFTSFDEAKVFVQQTKKRYIMKPSGNIETWANYPSKNWKDMVRMLDFWKKNWTEEVRFVLQEMIDGQQMSIEGWYDGKKWKGWNSTFEYKPLMKTYSDTAPFTGECGSVVFYYGNEFGRLYNETFAKLIPHLRGYPSGPLDINCILNEEGAWFLEFTSRQGYPATYIQLLGVEDEWGKIYSDIAKGQFDGFHPKAEWITGARFCVPQWPYGRVDKAYIGAPLFTHFKKKHLENILFLDVYLDEVLRCGGTDGELGTCVGWGKTINEASKMMYDILKEVATYPMFYRPDIGEGLDLQSLVSWGYYIPKEDKDVKFKDNEKAPKWQQDNKTEGKENNSNDS